ncbi:unnamed protein product [Brassica rapa subsp. narinosa]
MAKVFNEDEMVLLYRFSLEIEKAKNSLDLNLGPAVESGDHIVPTGGRTDGDRFRANMAIGYGESSRQGNLGTGEEVAGETNADNIQQGPGEEGNNGGAER